MARFRERTGLNVTLPTEAQWEYACRAGTTTSWSFGDNESAANNYMWFSANSNRRTQPVGQKQATPWGLRDMHGNVWEWCLDWYGSYSGASHSDYQRTVSSSNRVGRGGCWNQTSLGCRSAYRIPLAPGGWTDHIGFRVVIILSAP